MLMMLLRVCCKISVCFVSMERHDVGFTAFSACAGTFVLTERQMSFTTPQ
jgi:hypothetical protein